MILLITGALDRPLLFLRTGLLDGLLSIAAWPLELLIKFAVG